MFRHELLLLTISWAATSDLTMGKKEEVVDLNANNEEEWDALKAHEGLIVVDIYSKWAGPCTVMKAIIYKIKGKVSSMGVYGYGWVGVG